MGKHLLFYCIAGFLPLLVSCGWTEKSPSAWSDAIAVEVLTVGNDNAASTRNYVGDIGSEQETDLSFPMGGTLTRVAVKNGDRVVKGQLLAEVDATTATSLHASALATLRQAEDAHRRLEAVHREGGLSEVKWVEMETNLEKARQAELSARKHLEDCSIRAPFSGVVSCPDRHVGQDMKPGEVFGRLLDMSRLRVNFSVPEQEIALIHIGDSASASIPALSDLRLRLSVADKGIVANPFGHTYKVRAAIRSAYPVQLLPDMVAKVSMVLDSTAGIAIPTSCVQTMPYGTAVWVISGGKAERRAVVVGDFSHNNVFVVDGLMPGDSVVTSGSQKLYTGAKVICK